MTLGSTNDALGAWFLQQAGIDVNKFKFVDLTSTAMGPALEVGQVAAIDIPEPGYDTFLGSIPTCIRSRSTSPASGSRSSTRPTPPSRAQAHTDQSAALITKTIPGGQASVIQVLFSNKTRVPLDMVSATDLKSGLSGVIDAGLATGYVKEKPGSSFLYSGLNK